eukprot:3031204-Pyramimonas_sp.AAC.1
MPARQAAAAAQAVLDVMPYARFSANQRRGLGQLTLAPRAMQLRERAVEGRVSGARGDPGGAPSAAGASETQPAWRG